MSAQPLAGKVALITGGSKGIGRAVALRLAKDGAVVVINYSSDASAADEVVKNIGSDRCVAIQADAGSLGGIERLVKETVDQFGKIDILIPNAGVAPNLDLEHTTEEMFDRTYNVNVKGPYFLCQKAAPHMGEGSRVILVSTSLCAFSPITPNYLLYVSSKGAIEQMTRVLAKDLGRKGVRVNAISPGPTGTDLFYTGKSEELLARLAGASPLNKIGDPEDIADVFAILASPDSRWVAGQIIRVNGGMTVG
ncbi:MAG: hypothetical protein Q9195_000467 [Heterodermia aff. obscurata]